MPAQKRSMPENLTDDDDEDPTTLHNQKAKQSRPQDDEHQLEISQQHEDEVEDDDRDEEEADDSEEDSPSSTTQEKPEFLFVQLSEIRKDVHCPICLGIIKKTRTVMECLHRFCRECIDKSMRMGNNECPACRTHCASRRSLRDDPNYDAVIASLYPDIEKYEEEELAFHEEERTRNEQIQASIAQIFQRQSEALIKRRSLGKDTQDAFIIRSQRNSRTGLPRRRSSRATELQGSEDNDNENGNNNVGTQSPSTDERRTEVRPRRPRRQAGLQSSQPSSVINSNGACTENDLEVNQEIKRIFPGLVWSSEMLAWGRGGARSHTRNGIASSCNNKISRRTRISKLVNYLRSLEETNDELDVHLMLISLDTRCTPSLQQPHLCCRPNLSVKHLCEYVAHQTPLQAEEVELFSVKGYHSSNDEKLTLKPSDLMNDLDSVPHPIDPSRYDLQILREEETMAGIKANCTSNKDFLILAYRRKEILLGI